MKKWIMDGLAIALLMLGSAAACLAQPTVAVSGGGLNALSTAINATTDTGATLVIQDSLTYTESAVLNVGQRYDATHGRRAFRIEAAPGATPTIVLNGAAFTIFSSAADVQIGSAAGGRITIDAFAAQTTANEELGMLQLASGFYYVPIEEGPDSEVAAKLTLENLQINAGNSLSVVLFGNSDRSTANMGGARLVLRQVEMHGSQRAIWNLFRDSGYDSFVDIEHSEIFDPSAFGVLMADQLGAGSVLNMQRSIVYIAPSVAPQSRAVFSRSGSVLIDHCDIINEGQPTQWGVALADAPSCVITHSTIRGHEAVRNDSSGTATVVDSNVTATGNPNPGDRFQFTNVIMEWPIYLAHGNATENPLNFHVNSASLSWAHGAEPPLGSVGLYALPSRVGSSWMQY